MSIAGNSRAALSLRPHRLPAAPWPHPPQIYDFSTPEKTLVS